MWKDGIWASEQGLTPKGIWRNASKKGAWSLSVTQQIKELLYGSGQQGAFFVPQPTVDGQQVLYQESAGTTPVTADGQPVGYIKDLSGNGNHATQTTAAAKPLYPGLGYDGVDDRIKAPIPGSGLFDLVVGVRLPAVASKFILATGDARSSFVYAAAEADNTTAPDNESGTPSYLVNGTAIPGATRGDLWTATPKGAWGVLEIHDIDVGQWAGKITLSGYNALGFPLEGDIGSCVVRSTMTASERDAARQFVADQHGVTL